MTTQSIVQATCNQELEAGSIRIVFKQYQRHIHRSLQIQQYPYLDLLILTGDSLALSLAIVGRLGWLRMAVYNRWTGLDWTGMEWTGMGS